MDRSIASGLIAALGATVLAATPAAAASNTCIAGKLACANAFATATFKCYAKIFKAGFTGENADKAEECIRKARRKFGTAVTNKVACWDKVESKEDPAKPETVCPAGIFDEYDVDHIVKDFTLDVVNNEIAPGGAVSFGSSCTSGKVNCLGKLFNAMLKCEIKAHKAGVAVEDACIDKAVAKFDGGGMPAKGCFAKLEAKQKLGKIKSLCDATGNTASALGTAQFFVAYVAVSLEP